jgi:hypothetical protein
MEPVLDTPINKKPLSFIPIPNNPVGLLTEVDSLTANRWKHYLSAVSNPGESFYPMTLSKRFWTSTGQVAVGYGLFLTILFISPPAYTKWDNYFGEELLLHAGSKLKDAWTRPPVWDHDTYFTNYICHPYAGSFYYNTMRTKGGSAAASFGFSVFSSTLWEYGLEAFFEQPSIQDLIVTPIVGSIVGEAVHRLTLEMSIGGFNFPEKLAVLFLNPSYVMNHGFKVPSEDRRRQLRKLSY